MAGRNHIPAHALGLRDQIDEPRFLHRAPPHSAALHRPHPSLVEERIAAQQRGIQSLLLDNQRLAATHVALKQELAAAQQEIRHLSVTADTVKAERDAQVREVFERALKMEAEVRLIDGVSSELDQVRADVQKLIVERKELTAKLQSIESDLVRAHLESREVPAIKSEIELVHKEIQRGRAAIEYEKKTHESNIRQGEAMERSLISMAREIEKLRSELANAEKRAQASVAASSPGGYGGNSYPDPYAMYQGYGSGDGGQQLYNHGGVVANGPYDSQSPHGLGYIGPDSAVQTPARKPPQAQRMQLRSIEPKTSDIAEELKAQSPTN